MPTVALPEYISHTKTSPLLLTINIWQVILSPTGAALPVTSRPCQRLRAGWGTVSACFNHSLRGEVGVTLNIPHGGQQMPVGLVIYLVGYHAFLELPQAVSHLRQGLPHIVKDIDFVVLLKVYHPVNLRVFLFKRRRKNRPTLPGITLSNFVLGVQVASPRPLNCITLRHLLEPGYVLSRGEARPRRILSPEYQVALSHIRRPAGRQWQLNLRAKQCRRLSTSEIVAGVDIPIQGDRKALNLAKCLVKLGRDEPGSFNVVIFG